MTEQPLTCLFCTSAEVRSNVYVFRGKVTLIIYSKGLFLHAVRGSQGVTRGRSGRASEEPLLLWNTSHKKKKRGKKGRKKKIKVGRWGSKKQWLWYRGKRVSSVFSVPERPLARPKEGPRRCRRRCLGAPRWAAGQAAAGRLRAVTGQQGTGEKPSRRQPGNRRKALEQPPSPAPWGSRSLRSPSETPDAVTATSADERSNPAAARGRAWTAPTDREKEGNNSNIIVIYLCNYIYNKNK